MQNSFLYRLVLAAVLVSAAGLLHAASRPNVVVVFVDDMGWSDVSAFGGTRAVTENIDRLAKEGHRFTQFYVNSPICSPSRVALTTGQYPQRWRVNSYLANRKENDRRGVAQWLDPSAPVLARELQKAGYRTGHFGKWHMGGQRDVDDAPAISEYGFDQSLTNFEGMGAKLLPIVHDPKWAEPRKIWEDAVNLGEPVTWTPRWEITGGFVNAAIKFIDASEQADEPFYINVWPDDVHSPYFPDPKNWKPRQRGRYFQVLDSMDEQLGVLFDRIRDDPKLRDNTLIVFCSDNGPQDSIGGSSKPLRGWKTWLYEGGTRSPLIVWGPGLLDKSVTGSTNDESVFSAIDLNRSLYSLCQVDVPEGAKLDGEDLSDAILGRSKSSRVAPIFWRRPPDRPGFGAGSKEDNPDLAMREGNWKYLENIGGTDRQLYDLAKDPSEKHNVADQHPEVVDAMHAAVAAWNDSLPQDASNPEWRG
ncbi:sulfatase-like hydrolase/transferase [Aeoliella sp. SH292]|uniref:sulfatase-like hydrolase/transferase n=1 Tax=Aeoliella sp. SH292 TaxID=3454464 RepID=UPI003F9A144B